jgi:hypothetical protein
MKPQTTHPIAGTGAQNVIGDATAFASLGTASWLTNVNLLSNYQMVVRGNTGDKLVLSAGDGYDTSGWVKGATNLPFATDPANSNAPVSDGRTYTRWSNASLKIDVLVDNDIETSNKFVSFTGISTDTGSSSSDFITTDTTLSLSGAVSSLATGDVVKVTVLNSSNVKVVDNVTASVSNGVWTLDNQANALALGNYTVKTTIVSSGTTFATAQDRIVQVIAANDTPVNNGLAALSTNEDTALAITGLSVTDATNNGDNYTVTLGVTNGVLNVSGGTATIAGSGTNTVTLTGTKAAINATLAATVSYAPTDNFSGSAQLTMTTNDGSLGDAKTDTDTIAITVNTVNDAPVVVTSATARSYTENAAGVAANDTLTLSDADSANLTGATVQITTGLTTGDVLAFTNANGITGSYDAATGKLTLSGTATVAQYQAALQSVTYSSTSDDPTATSTSRTLSWQVNDGQTANNASNVGTSTINVTAVDPLITTLCESAINWGSVGWNSTTGKGSGQFGFGDPFAPANSPLSGATIKFYVNGTLGSTGTLNTHGYINGFSLPDLIVVNDDVVHGEVVLNGVTYVVGGGFKYKDPSQTPGFDTGTFSSYQFATPLVLDLNGDGVQTVSTDQGVKFDLFNAEDQQQVGWVSKQDGLLAMDINGDGQINSGRELFGNNTLLPNGEKASDGWAALAAQDTNADGVVDAKDANFDKLRVWVDADTDGVTDAGELKSLADVNIASIATQADDSIVFQNGNLLKGQSSFTTTDGVQHAVTDALLGSVAPANAAPANVFSLSDGMSLDLSAVTGAAKLTEVNAAADTAANTIKLTLADVLGASGSEASSGAVHQLKLTGDVNDTAVFNANEWLSTDTTVSQNGHTYAVYNAANDAAAQLLIDQHMALAHNG